MFLVSKEIRSFCKLRPRGWLTAQSNSPSVPQKLELYLGGGGLPIPGLGFQDRYILHCSCNWDLVRVTSPHRPRDRYLSDIDQNFRIERRKNNLMN